MFGKRMLSAEVQEDESRSLFVRNSLFNFLSSPPPSPLPSLSSLFLLFM
jgi:hypothetical protein